jgi:hypothetical protein
MDVPDATLYAGSSLVCERLRDLEQRSERANVGR